MTDNLKEFRQPMVTAIGIILGFVMGFSADWATETVDKSTNADYFVGLGLAIGVLLLITALFRILNANYPKENANVYYQRTLYIFITGLGLSFLGIASGLIQAILHF
ncbi:MAG: hypothetical protein AB8G86_25900 [Saprospiraceae bacterium]